MPLSIRNIISKATAKNANESDKQLFWSLFHKPELEFELKGQLLKDLEESPAPSGNETFFDAVFERFWQKSGGGANRDNKNVRFLIQVSKWVAILVLGLLLGFYFNPAKKSSPVYYTSNAPKGSNAEMLLPDGTHIFLNSGSQIKYSIDGTAGIREVFLNGEAWFEVAKMKEKPFVVHTTMYDVKVMGTSFDVKAYQEDNEIITTLEEGSVQILSAGKLKITNEAILKPGDQFTYNKELEQTQVSKVNPKLYSSWKENKLVFVNMELKNLRILLERKYGVDIKIDDEDILDYHYDGIFKGETILEVLEILRHTLPIEYKIVDQNIIIQKLKKEGK